MSRPLTTTERVDDTLEDTAVQEPQVPSPTRRRYSQLDGREPVSGYTQLSVAFWLPPAALNDDTADGTADTGAADAASEAAPSNVAFFARTLNR